MENPHLCTYQALGGVCLEVDVSRLRPSTCICDCTGQQCQVQTVFVCGNCRFNSAKPRKSHPHCRKLFSQLEELSSARLAGPDRDLQPWNYHSNYFKNGKSCQLLQVNTLYGSVGGHNLSFFFYSTCGFCHPHLTYPTL